MTVMQRIVSNVQVTNAAFLRELAQAAPKGSCLWVCHFKGEPLRAQA